MENGSEQAVALSSNAMQRRAIIAKIKASGLAKRQIEDNESSDDDGEQEYNFEKLKTFHIPRKKEQHEGKGLLTELSLQSREFTHTLYPNFKSSFLYPQSIRKVRVIKVEMVNNQQLQKEFLEKKKIMKEDGRSDKELVEYLAYLHLPNMNEVIKICEGGLSIGNTGLTTLGKASMGVYVCKHADIVSPVQMKSKDAGIIVVFKIIKGKTKLVAECRMATTTQEPTPLYDSHITKLTEKGSKGSHLRAYEALQYYLYEYGELDLLKRPRQILPHAVIHYTYDDTDKIDHTRESLVATEMFPSCKDVVTPSNDLQTFCLWKGKLLVKGGVFCHVQMRTDVDTAVNKAFLDKNLNVKIFVSADKFSKLIPPTLLAKSGKKHNVLYRGRNYNIFTLTPSTENGFGKFRQLIAHLVQENAVAVVPLRMASCMYLMANSNLTVNRMGLVAETGEDGKLNTHFLHVLVVTPRTLSSKVNDQKIYNVITVRKRKDSQGECRIPDELDQKLRAMNIDPSTAVGSMQREHLDKLLAVLKDKKRFQVGDKLLLNHYKDNENLLPTRQGHNKFAGKIGSLWSTTCQARMEYYKPKDTVDEIPSDLEEKVSVKKSRDDAVTPAVSPQKEKKRKQQSSSYNDQEATFSDEGGSDNGDAPHSEKLSNYVGVAKATDKPTKATEKRKLSIEIDTKSNVPPVKISRPSFKAVEEILSTNDVSALIRHPDFIFSERFEKTHRVTKGPDFNEKIDFERENQINVVFRQKVPFSTQKDCPYAFDGNAVVKSMLRAIYGVWDEDDVNTSLKDREKVDWVRNVLHRKKNQTSDPRQAVLTSEIEDRKVTGRDESPMAKDPHSSLSPSAPGGSSTDSGFASSSTLTTPNAVPQQASSSSIHDLASLLASALQDKPLSAESSLVTKAQESVVQSTTKDILQVLAKSVNESGHELPHDLKEIMKLSSPTEKIDNEDNIDELNLSPPEPGLLSLSPSSRSPTPAYNDDELNAEDSSLSLSLDSLSQEPENMMSDEHDRSFTPPPAPPGLTFSSSAITIGESYPASPRPISSSSPVDRAFDQSNEPKRSYWRAENDTPCYVEQRRNKPHESNKPFYPERTELSRSRSPEVSRYPMEPRFRETQQRLPPQDNAHRREYNELEDYSNKQKPRSEYRERNFYDHRTSVAPRPPYHKPVSPQHSNHRPPERRPWEEEEDRWKHQNSHTYRSPRRNPRYETSPTISRPQNSRSQIPWDASRNNHPPYRPPREEWKHGYRDQW